MQPTVSVLDQLPCCVTTQIPFVGERQWEGGKGRDEWFEGKGGRRVHGQGGYFDGSVGLS